MISTVAESAFAARRQGDWSRLDGLVRRVTLKGYASLATDDLLALAPLYRDACADLAAARAARYSAALVDSLSSLTASAHTVLYGAESRGALATSRGASLFAAFEAFPRAVRAHKGAVMLSAALFLLPFLAGALAAYSDPSFAFRIVPESTLRPLTEAYARGFEGGRGSGEGALMAGFYVNNNVGIALRCFAVGIFGGLGSAFYLVDNGLSIGAVLGYVSSQGAGANIATFIVGHGSLELTAIVLAGGAGLVLGWSVVSPGGRTRAASLRSAGRDVAAIVFGAAVMLMMAACIEAFWSASGIPSPVKRLVGAALWTLVLSYFVLVGRTSKRPETGSAVRPAAPPGATWT